MQISRFTVSYDQTVGKKSKRAGLEGKVAVLMEQMAKARLLGLRSEGWSTRKPIADSMGLKTQFCIPCSHKPFSDSLHNPQR